MQACAPVKRLPQGCPPQGRAGQGEHGQKEPESRPRKGRKKCEVHQDSSKLSKPAMHPGSRSNLHSASAAGSVSVRSQPLRLLLEKTQDLQKDFQRKK